MKKTPKTEKIAKGTFIPSRDKQGRGTPFATLKEIPPAPTHLSSEAAEIFTATCKTLKNAGKLTSDIVGLAADYSYFSAEAARWQQRCVDIDARMAEGMDPALMRQFTAAARLSRQNSSQAAKLAKMLNILPGDRTAEPDQDDLFEREFLQ